MISLNSLLPEIQYEQILGGKSEESPVSDIVYHTDKAGPGTLFVCLCGFRADGHFYADKAYEKGVRLFVCERVLALPGDALQIVVKDSRLALSRLSAAFFGHPEKKLRLIGITGTKGKSTVCAMIAHVLNQCGIPTGSIGTCGAYLGDERETTANSTPESYELYRLFDKMVKKGIGTAVMEVSSQSVFQKRVEGLSFFACIMTNLTPDHIGDGEHPSFEHYKECKKAIFSRCEYAVINRDFPCFEEFKAASVRKILTYSVKKEADIWASQIKRTITDGRFGISFEMNRLEESACVTLPMPGEYSVSDALAAFSLCSLLGISAFRFAKTIKTVSVPGRFEYVDTKETDIGYILDYAHTEESLRAVLTAISDYNPKRIICLFGSVGGRTRLRRAGLGKAAAEKADVIILTSDNPDFEDPEEICLETAAQIEPGKYRIIPDRREAIRYAVSIAEPGDVVLLAGKGHEEYQLICGVKEPFSEKAVLLQATEEKMLLGAR